MKRAFTLIELLVVVLIIGILAAIALPQYQKAVRKAQLMRLVPFVSALYQAEEDYFLANGTYTDDFNSLAVSLPTETCFYSSGQYGNAYYCKDYVVGIMNDITNIQVQVRYTGIAYLQFINDLDTEPSGIKFKKGDTVCFSRGETNRQVCRSLGLGEEKEHGQGWDYVYILN